MARPMAVLLSLGLLAALAVVAAPVRGLTGDPVLLNEILVDHTGPDTGEFVELYGQPGASLAGMSLVVVDGRAGGNPGAVTFRLDFAADARIGGNGFFLVGDPTGLWQYYEVVPNVAIGDYSFPDASETFALLPTAVTPAPGAKVSGGETTVDAVGITGGGGGDVFFFGAPIVGPDPYSGFFPAGVRRVTDGVDTDTAADWTFSDFLMGPTNTPTAGTAWNAPVGVTCPASLSTTAGTAVSGPVTATDADGTVTSLSVSVSPDPGTITLSGMTPAGAAGGTANATLAVGAATPTGSYVATLTATNDDAAPQSASCSVSVTVDAAPTPPSAPPSPPTPGGPSVAELASLVQADIASGAVPGRQAHLLTDRLTRIERFMASGQLAAARAQLQAFANQVRGLSPRWVAPSTADALAGLALRLASPAS
jgi:hypothetical protein